MFLSYVTLTNSERLMQDFRLRHLVCLYLAASINPSHLKSLLNTGCKLLPVQGLLLLGAITHHHMLSVQKLPHPAQSTDNLSREHGNFLEVYAALLDCCSQFFS